MLMDHGKVCLRVNFSYFSIHMFYIQSNSYLKAISRIWMYSLSVQKAYEFVFKLCKSNSWACSVSGTNGDHPDGSDQSHETVKTPLSAPSKTYKQLLDTGLIMSYVNSRVIAKSLNQIDTKTRWDFFKKETFWGIGVISTSWLFLTRVWVPTMSCRVSSMS